MRIAFVGQQEEKGRLGTYVNQVAKRMVEKGHEVFIYVRGASKTPEITEGNGVKIVSLPGIGKDKKSLSGLELSSLFHVLIKKYDIVHIGTSAEKFPVRLLKILERKVAIVRTFEEGSSHLYKIPHGIIITSEEAKKHVSSEHMSKVSLIHTISSEKKGDKKYNLAEWNIREKRFALFCGRLEENSGLDKMMEVFKKLEDTCKLPNNFKLVIVGQLLEQQDFEYLEKLREISKNRSNIILIKSRSPKLQAELMQEAYVYITPQTSEVSASTLISAMSAGLPIIANNNGYNRQILGDAALYFSEKDGMKLEEKMAFLLNRPDEAKRLEEIALQRAQKEYGWDTVTEKTLGVYKKIISAK